MKAALILLGVGLLGSCILRPYQFFNTAPLQATPDDFVVIESGGSEANKQDLLWITARIKMADGKLRTVLALYQADQQGKIFQLRDTRWIDPDLRFNEYREAGHKPKVKDIFKALPKKEQEKLVPPKKEEKK